MTDRIDPSVAQTRSKAETIQLDPVRQEKFWRHVTKGAPNGCWEWTGEHGSNDYGMFKITDRPTRRRLMAHRISYALTFGQVPRGMLVLHKCDNRKCVNPAHLFAGTQADNIHDMIRKGRMADTSGERCSAAKLKCAQVLEIRAAHSCGVKYRELAQRFGVSESHISSIITGRLWKKLTSARSVA